MNLHLCADSQVRQEPQSACGTAEHSSRSSPNVRHTLTPAGLGLAHLFAALGYEWGLKVRLMSTSCTVYAGFAHTGPFVYMYKPCITKPNPRWCARGAARSLTASQFETNSTWFAVSLDFVGLSYACVAFELLTPICKFEIFSIIGADPCHRDGRVEIPNRISNQNLSSNSGSTTPYQHS